MPFGLKNAPAIFSRIVVVAFKDFIQTFLAVYIDDWMDGLWIDKGSCHKPVTNVGEMLITSHCTEFEEVHILCTFWDVARAHCM